MLHLRDDPIVAAVGATAVVPVYVAEKFYFAVAWWIKEIATKANDFNKGVNQGWGPIGF